MTRTAKTLALALPAALLLAGCNGETAPAEQTGEAEESGEVLEGTISDAMLPLDQVRSQAPQADPEPETGDSGATTSGSAPAPAQASEPAVEPVPDAEVAAPDAGESEGAE